MSARRTTVQKDADTFDCDLYRLMERAGRYAEKDTGAAGGQWGRIYSQLRAARYHVRNLMHPDDRKDTVG